MTRRAKVLEVTTTFYVTEDMKVTCDLHFEKIGIMHDNDTVNKVVDNAVNDIEDIIADRVIEYIMKD